MKVHFAKDQLIQMYRVKTNMMPEDSSDVFEVEMSDEEIKHYFVTMNDFICLQKRIALAHLESVKSER